MSLKFKRHLLDALAPIALAVPTAPALAQDGPAAETGGEEIVVTARRVEERLQDAPVAVTAFTAQALDNVAAENISAVQGAVPNLNLVQGRGSSSSANVYIRGVGQPDALATFDPGVGIYVDDVYISRIRGALFDVFDVERIEVLRGPQGTLYGKNTIGGAIKLVTKRPGDELDGDLRLTVGDYNRQEVSAKVSLPLGETAGLAGSLYSSKRDGFVTDPLSGREYNDKDTVAGRVGLYANPGPRTDIVLSADFTKERPGLTVGRQENVLVATPNVVRGGVAVPRSGGFLIAPPTGEFNFRTAATTSTPNQQKLDHWGLASTISFDATDALTLKSITAFRALTSEDFIDIDANPVQIGDVFVGVEQEQVSQEFQALYDGGGPISAVAGLYFIKENIKSNQNAFFDDFAFQGTALVPGVLYTGATRFIADAQELFSYAAFANLDWRISDTVTASAGIRYTEDEKDYKRSTFIRFRTNSAVPALAVIDAGAFAFQGKQSWDDVSPAFTLNWKPAEDVTLYGRAAKGFKSGGFNGRANAATDSRVFNPETVWTYELGAKTQWFDRRVTANAAIFTSTYEDFQARVSRGSGVNTELGVLNAGELEIAGAELELTVRPIPSLTLEQQVGYLDAQYKVFNDNQATGPGLNGSRAFQTPAFSPKWTSRSAFGWTVPLGGIGSARLGADASYRDEMALAVDNSRITAAPGLAPNVPVGARFPGMWQDAYWLYNAALIWTLPNENFSLTLAGKNLSDEVYKTDAQEFSGIGGIQTAYYGAPRTVSLTLGVRF